MEESDGEVPAARVAFSVLRLPWLQRQLEQEQ